MRLVYISGLLFAANLLAVSEAALLLPLTCAFLVFSLIRLKMRSIKAAAAKEPQLRMVVNNGGRKPKGQSGPQPEPKPEPEEAMPTQFPSTPEGRRKAEQAFLKVVKGRGDGGERLH